MSIKFGSVKPGDILWQKLRRKMGTTTISQDCIFSVLIESVDKDFATVRWNGNASRPMHRRDVEKLYRNRPVPKPTIFDRAASVEGKDKAVSDILSREETVLLLTPDLGGPSLGACAVLLRSDAALREVIRQAVEYLDDSPHSESCAYINSLLRYGCTGKKEPTKDCDCGHAAAIANLKKAGEK